MSKPENPNYPTDPETGQPSLSPDELQTGEHTLPDGSGMDVGEVLEAKARQAGYDGLSEDQEIVFEDDSDNEALKTFRRYQEG